MDLFKAAALGDVASLEKNISETGLETRDEEGCTPLMVAVKSDQADVTAVEYLLQLGADPNAIMIPPEPEPIDAQTLELIQEEGIDLPDTSSFKLPRQSVLSIAAQHSSAKKVEALVTAGADPKFVDDHGYGILLMACYGAFKRIASDNETVFRLLHRSGAPYTGETKYGESVVSVLSNHCHFELLKVALELGAGDQQLDWTPLYHAIAFKKMDQFHVEADKSNSLEQRDRWNRTPFLLAIAAGNTEAAQWLVAHGCDIHAVGHCGKTALMYAVSNDDPDCCRWLIELGCEVSKEDEFDQRALDVAIESDSLGCARVLIDVGADIFRVSEHGFGLMSEVDSPEMASLLMTAGLDASEIQSSVRQRLTGSDDRKEIKVGKDDFLKNRVRCFGSANPEKMNNAFWQAMVRTRKSAYAANTTYGISSFDFEGPTWCFERFGHSLTPLPDGRFVEIGGEHEDSYDPDFCIYNDVVVHDGKGDFEIYGYPKSVFPPTDFHTATYLNEKIYVIGCLRYFDDRKHGQTPVYILNCRNWSVEKMEVPGDCPGWIFKHRAKLIDDRFIQVSCGKIGTSAELSAQPDVWVLDTLDICWSKTSF